MLIRVHHKINYPLQLVPLLYYTQPPLSFSFSYTPGIPRSLFTDRFSASHSRIIYNPKDRLNGRTELTKRRANFI